MLSRQISNRTTASVIPSWDSVGESEQESGVDFAWSMDMAKRMGLLQRPTWCLAEQKTRAAQLEVLSFSSRGGQNSILHWELKLKNTIKRKIRPCHHPSPRSPLLQLQRYNISSCVSGGGLRARREGKTDGLVMREEVKMGMSCWGWWER